MWADSIAAFGFDAHGVPVIAAHEMPDGIEWWVTGRVTPTPTPDE